MAVNREEGGWDSFEKERYCIAVVIALADSIVIDIAIAVAIAINLAITLDIVLRLRTSFKGEEMDGEG